MRIYPYGTVIKSAPPVFDSGGLEQDCTEDDHCTGLVRLHSIANGNLLLADAQAIFPWRALHVVR